MIVEYRIASYLGCIWHALHAMPKSGDGPMRYRQVAQGAPLSAGELLTAQVFAARAWMLTAIAGGTLFFLAAVGGAALPGGTVRSAFAYLLLFFIGAAIAASVQMAMISYRKNQTRRYMLYGGPIAVQALSRPRSGTAQAP